MYANPTTAFLLSDEITTKLASVILSTITKGENLGGTRLVRGWNEVQKLSIQTPSPVLSTSASPNRNRTESGKVVAKTESLRNVESNEGDGYMTASESPTSSPADKQPQSRTESMTEIDDLPSQDEFEGEREIKHLIFAIHGIGQKLGERTELVNFTHDCNNLRKMFKDNAALIYKSISDLNGDLHGMPEGGGIQVLPIHWRHNLHMKPTDQSSNSGSEHHDEEDEDPGLEDITLEGVPSVRALVSDLVLDVLFYLTPKYRQQMVKNITLELNRIYKLYLSRNPTFKGKVHIFGHSLGSLLSFDILSHTSSSDRQQKLQKRQSSGVEVDLSDMNVSSLFSRKGSQRRNSIDGNMTIVYPALDFAVDALFRKFIQDLYIEKRYLFRKTCSGRISCRVVLVVEWKQGEIDHK